MARESSLTSEAQRRAYLEGHRRNPLTTTPLGGRILSASQLLWFTLFPPRGFGVLTTTGRRTGKRRRKCVRAIRDGDKAYLVSLRGPYAAWMRNIRANPKVELRIRGGRFAGVARDVIYPEERARAEDVYCGTVNRFDRLEYRMHRKGRPTADAVRALHRHWFAVGTPLVVELSTPEGRSPTEAVPVESKT
ncbi:MAG: nitroreductase family deazaflavin-dependent oxidoreductase [Actinomycetota bacterium]|nr:nitroreductase family deazaflavin-dependent oxidoreductase [Actinomycetota bacterium]